jgi:CDP-glucose 4,6-dehydratase
MPFVPYFELYMNTQFNGIYNGITVLVTGHTGFKGSWLAIWLHSLGAKVVGFSLPEPVSTPSNFQLTNLTDKIIDIRGDIRDVSALKNIINEYQPKIVFHLAAQPLLFKAYDDPKLTMDTNAGGTVNVLEAVRTTQTVEAVVCITTDKVYKNKEWAWGYRETDEIGDKDPYAAGKAMAELAIECYRSSFFSGRRVGDRQVAVASTRAGNVVGGGDFADFRLVPDSMKALLVGNPIELRCPNNIRPWQHVLEPLSGYLMLGAKLLENTPDKVNFCKAWNFGPQSTKNFTAGEVSDLLIKEWGHGTWINTGANENKKESNLLMLDCSRAHRELDWKPVYSCPETMKEVVLWFKEYAKQNADTKGINMYDTCVAQIENYVKKAGELGLSWVTK